MKNKKTIYELASPIASMHWSCVGVVMAVVKRIVIGLTDVITCVITWLEKVTGPSRDM
ncbi:hypothetical protein [Tissierella praeacuta]|uniref:hypothetical protein n=1 Tax=Tissierella praeacuta TaxID=43131 RepID=UPI0028A94D6A|nr:hypothetical protein [Tissierella praeacuta]